MTNCKPNPVYSMYTAKDYRDEPMYSLYADSIDFEQMLKRQNEHGNLSNGYWAAWFAARRTAESLLNEARAIGCTPEQLEALRVVAARVATD
jgi:choline kinase